MKRDRGAPEDELPDDGPSLTDYPPNPARDRYGRLAPTRCTCGPRSEEPCDFCAGGWDS